jgi:hypothetical protein
LCWFHPFLSFSGCAVQELFNVLDDRSDGLMLHFTHTFDNLIRRDPTAVIQILLADNAVCI